MKKIKIIVLAAITVMGLSMCSQNKQTAAVEDEPVDSCAVMAEFEGGQEALVKYIADNVKYPEKAEEVGLEGRVLVNFIIEKDGSVSNVEVAESADSLLDAEAVRVISSMPTWKAGQNDNGEAVRVKFTIPVVFLLDGTREDIEKQPEFPGGLPGYAEFFKKNMKYPAECEENGISGRVLVKFTVDEKGAIVDPFILKSAHPLLDAEALRLVKAMPKWTPGEDGGKPTAVKYVLPVTFMLQG